MSTDNLKYLTSEQALADLAYFRNYLAAAKPGSDKASTPSLNLKASAADSKFVAFGGSYPGNLAAWVKIKYGSLFVGTVASSAPVYAEYNYEQYAQVQTLRPPLGPMHPHTHTPTHTRTHAR